MGDCSGCKCDQLKSEVFGSKQALHDLESEDEVIQPSRTDDIARTLVESSLKVVNRRVKLRAFVRGLLETGSERLLARRLGSGQVKSGLSRTSRLGDIWQGIGSYQVVRGADALHVKSVATFRLQPLFLVGLTSGPQMDRKP